MKKIDKLLQRVEFFERLAVYGDRKTFLQALAQDMSIDPNMSIEPSAPNMSRLPMPEMNKRPNNEVKDSGGVVNIPAGDEIKAYPPIDPHVQKMLNDLLVPSGDIFLLKEDGKLGKNTKDALKKFQDKYGKPGTPQAVAQVWNSTKNNVAKTDPGAPVAPMSSNTSVDTKANSNSSAGEPRDIGNPKA